MPGLLATFEKNMLDIFGFRVPRRIALAVSGGVDSMALTSLMSRWAQSRGTKLKAFVVDHQLRKNSSSEARSVQTYIETQFQIPATVLTLNSDDLVRTNLEEWARLNRRKIIFEALARENIHTLALGHHLNDQIELFVQRFLKKSSWYGLAGMRASSYANLSTHSRQRPLNQVRPNLNVSKQSLIDWCQQENVQWWEDSTNADPNLTSRNLIRQMYARNEAPAAYAAPQVTQLVNFFGEQRQKVLDTAYNVLEHLKITNCLTINDNSRSARLQISKELSDLPPAVQTEVLYRIVAPLSPKPDDLIAKRRSSLSLLAQKFRLGSEHRFQHNVMGVLIRGTPFGWVFNREPLRAAELAHWEVYRATKQWSEFRSVDNRWFFRYRLTPKAPTEAGSRYFSLSFLSQPDAVLQPLITALHAERIKKIKQYVPLHPFLMWSDPADPYTITPGKIIGFPTLNLVVNGLDLEVLPKECVF